MLRRFTSREFFRLIAILIFSVLLTIFFPTVVFDQAATLTDPTFGLLIFVFVAGFLISQAITRQNKMRLAISVEQSRLRRLSHLARSVSNNAAFKKAVSLAIIDYMREVAKRDFRYYDEAHEKFRIATGLIYDFKPRTKRDEILFDEFLEVTRELAFYRQEVAGYLKSVIAPHTWAVLLILLLLNIATLLGSREPGFTSPLFIAAAVSGLLLIIDVLYDLSIMTPTDRKNFQREYLANAADLERLHKKHYGTTARKRRK